MATLSVLGGTTGARQDQEEDEGTERAPESAVGSPTPLSLGATGDGDSEADLTAVPSTQASVPGAYSVPSRSDEGLRDELSPESPVSAERVAVLPQLCLSGAERLAALLGPGQPAITESLLGTQRAGEA
ncbi:hypothetical protein ACSSS7_008073 [Eimeria intestinalis]